MKNEKLTEYELKLAKEVKNALLNDQRHKMLVYISGVSRSGMSRKIRFTFIDKDGTPLYLDYLLSKLGCGTLKEDGLLVRGCGMDMIFHTLCNFLSVCGVKEGHKWADNYTRI